MRIKAPKTEQQRKGGSMSHNAYRMLLFRAPAASGPNFFLAYHEIVRGEPGVASANAVND
jgi:hypothetical protein